MNQAHRSRQGFTLVEIMIVVVIIGLLAAMAIPAFNKVRRSSLEKAMLNDARQIGSAAQQYMMENGVTVITFSMTAGAIGGPLSDWVKQVTAALTSTDTTIEGEGAGTFKLKLPGAFGSVEQSFDAEGKKK